MLKIAITGNIASGKSQVEKMLKDKGYPVYDADIIAHEILDKVKDFYGYDVFSNGKVDRKKLGKLVFENEEIRKKLEELLHPMIREKIKEIFEEHQNDRYVFMSVPLLFEANFTSLFDKILFVSCSKKIRLKRLMKRNDLSEEEAMARINSQINEDEKITRSDYVIKNEDDIENLKTQVDSFCNVYLN